MRTIPLALSILLPLSAFAGAPASESAQLLKALVNNPSIVQELHDHGTDRITDVGVAPGAEGVTEFTLRFERSCYCLPQVGTVKIHEDLRPTWADGAPIYKASVSFTQER